MVHGFAAQPISRVEGERGSYVELFRAFSRGNGVLCRWRWCRVLVEMISRRWRWCRADGGGFVCIFLR